MELACEPASLVTERYERLLSVLSRTQQGWEIESGVGRSTALEEAAGIVFDLLFSLDFRNGGEVVPRLAGIYGFLAEELLTVGRTRDLARLRELRAIVGMLRTSA